MHFLIKLLSFLKKRKPHLILIVSIVIFIFLTTYNIKNQYVFNNDQSRDTLASLRILKSGEITLVGPPLSFGQSGLKKTYFSSLIYYQSALSLYLSNNSVIAPIIFIIIINASGIIPLVLLLRKQKKSLSEISVLTALYVTNPVVINYSRIMWNPSPLIGLGLWGLYALNVSPIMFGVVVGIAIYFHYFSAILLIFGLSVYGIKKQFVSMFKTVMAFVAMLLPFLVFEVKNNWYLTQSFFYNLRNAPTETLLQNKLAILIEIPSHILGLGGDFFGGQLIDATSYLYLVGLFLWVIFYLKNRRNSYFYFFLLAAVLTAIASESVVRLQYLLIALGALFVSSINIKSKVAKMFVMGLLVLQIVNTTYSITRSVYDIVGNNALTLKQLERVNSEIKNLHTQGKKFNITENVSGDARAMYLRFFLERDGIVDLQDEFHYENLEELYVITPSKNKTMTENRWELTATKGLKIVENIPIDSFRLLKYAQE